MSLSVNPTHCYIFAPVFATFFDHVHFFVVAAFVCGSRRTWGWPHIMKWSMLRAHAAMPSRSPSSATGTQDTAEYSTFAGPSTAVRTMIGVGACECACEE